MAMNKGFELQFHWVFVLIAGALILAFFANVALKQRGLSQQRFEFSSSSEIESILAVSNNGKSARNDLSNPGLKFACTDTCLCTMNKRPLRDVVFALTGDGDALSVWSRSFAVPYRAANMLFVTDSQVKYYFVGDSSDPLFVELTRNIPVVLSDTGSTAVINYENKTFGSAVDVKAEYETTRFVFVNRDPSRFMLDTSFKDEVASAVKVDSNAITFYQKESVGFFSVATFPRKDLSSVYAAIFSNDANMYECGMSRLTIKAELVVKVYKSRAQVLKEYTSAGVSDCPVIYDRLVELLDEKNFVELEEQNRELSRNGCPELF